jgi:hypothetical protein
VLTKLEMTEVLNIFHVSHMHSKYFSIDIYFSLYILWYIPVGLHMTMTKKKTKTFNKDRPIPSLECAHQVDKNNKCQDFAQK